MNVNQTGKIPNTSWETFWDNLREEKLTHRLVHYQMPKCRHISWVPHPRVDFLAEWYGKPLPKAGASVEFTFEGEEYRFRGKWPKKLDQQLGEAMDRILERINSTNPPSYDPVKIPGDHLPGIIALIEEMGGEATGQVTQTGPHSSLV